MTRLVATIVFLGALARVAAQDLPVLPLGKGDVIDVEIEGEDDLNRRVPVSSRGEISLPLLKERIQVAGLRPDAIEKLISQAYRQAQMLIDPTVHVKPAEYHSYLVKVTGAVVRPYEFQAIERCTLLRALATAGGPAPNSNGQIEILRIDRESGPESGPESGKATGQVISIRALIDGEDPRLNILLKGGEEVHLPALAAPPK